MIKISLSLFIKSPFFVTIQIWLLRLRPSAILSLLIICAFNFGTISATPNPNNSKELQRIVEHPENVTAKPGETIVLHCRVENQKGSLQWMANGFGLGTDRSIPGQPRMSMIGKTGNGEYHLQIQNISIEDDGFYQCQISPSRDGDSPQNSKMARLSIIVEPQLPALFVDDSNSPINRALPLPASEGKPISVECRSVAGRPYSRVQWALAQDREAQQIVGFLVDDSHSERTMNDNQLAMHGTKIIGRSVQKIITKPAEEAYLDTSIGQLNFTPIRTDNGLWLVCLVSHEAYGKEARSASVRLDVFYPPKVSVEVDPHRSAVHEGGRITLKCNVDARPSNNLIFEWVWNGDAKRLIDIEKQRMTIDRLGIHDNGAEVSCKVTNEFGHGNNTHKLNIPFGPRFLSAPQRIEVEIGETVNFDCDVVGNPYPEIEWFGPGNRLGAISKEKKLTIKDADEWSEGEYRCIATVHGFPAKSMSHRIFLKGPPKVSLAELEDTNLPTSETAEQITLSCQINQLKATQVIWFRDGKRLNLEQSHNSRFHQEDPVLHEYGTEIRLQIDRFHEADYGTYNCTARNEYGMGSAAYNVLRQNLWERLKNYVDKAPPQIIRLAIAIFILLLLILCFVFCTCARCCCRSKKSKDLINERHHKGQFEVKCEPVDFYGGQSSATCIASPVRTSTTSHLQQAQQELHERTLSHTQLLEKNFEGSGRSNSNSTCCGAAIAPGSSFNTSPQQLLDNEYYYSGHGTGKAIVDENTHQQILTPSGQMLADNTFGSFINHDVTTGTILGPMSRTNNYYCQQPYHEPRFIVNGKVIMAPNLAQNYDQNCEFQESYCQKLEPMYLQPRQTVLAMPGGYIDAVAEVSPDIGVPLLGTFTDEHHPIVLDQDRCISRISTHV